MSQRIQRPYLGKMRSQLTYADTFTKTDELGNLKSSQSSDEERYRYFSSTPDTSPSPLNYIQKPLTTPEERAAERENWRASEHERRNVSGAATAARAAVTRERALSGGSTSGLQDPLVAETVRAVSTTPTRYQASSASSSDSPTPPTRISRDRFLLNKARTREPMFINKGAHSQLPQTVPLPVSNLTSTVASRRQAPIFLGTTRPPLPETSTVPQPVSNFTNTVASRRRAPISPGTTRRRLEKALANGNPLFTNKSIREGKTFMPRAPKMAATADRLSQIDEHPQSAQVEHIVQVVADPILQPETYPQSAQEHNAPIMSNHISQSEAHLKSAQEHEVQMMADRILQPEAHPQSAQVDHMVSITADQQPHPVRIGDKTPTTADNYYISQQSQQSQQGAHIPSAQVERKVLEAATVAVDHYRHQKSSDPIEGLEAFPEFDNVSHFGEGSDIETSPQFRVEKRPTNSAQLTTASQDLRLLKSLSNYTDSSSEDVDANNPESLTDYVQLGHKLERVSGSIREARQGIDRLCKGYTTDTVSRKYSVVGEWWSTLLRCLLIFILFLATHELIYEWNKPVKPVFNIENWWGKRGHPATVFYRGDIVAWDDVDWSGDTRETGWYMKPRP